VFGRIAWSLVLVVGLGMPLAAQELDPGLFQAEEPVSPEEVAAALTDALAGAEADPGEAVTAGDPRIAPGALEILVEPLTLDQLRHEMAAWWDLHRAAAATMAETELELFALNAAEAEAAEAPAGESGGQAPADAPEDGAPAVSPEKKALIDEIGAERAVRTDLADRLRVVLDAFEAKGGEPGETAEIRAYLGAIGGVEVDVSNWETAWLTARQWVVAEDGGRRLARNAGILVGTVLLGAAVGWLLSLFVNHGLKRTQLSSRLLRHFLRLWIARLGGFVGLLFGLSMIGVNMTPILAALGAAGFILAFALQNTISNFASGLLILFQRPFDTGDEIEAAGVTGEVERVSLFSTHLSTAENRKVIVPNNMIWDDVIVNSTGAPTRRLSIEIEVNAADHSLEESEEILRRVMAAHPGVLEDPAPDLKLSAMTGDSLTFTCWPWVRTEDKDRVRWDLVSQFGRELTVLKGVAKSTAA